MKIKFFLIIFLIFSWFSLIHPSPVLELNDSIKSLDIHDFLYYFKENRLIDIQEISQDSFQANLRPTEVNVNHWGFSNESFWLKFKYKYTGQKNEKWIFKITNPYFSSIRLYCKGQNQNDWTLYITGNQLPFDHRPLPTRLYQFPIETKSNIEYTCFFRIFNDGGSINFSPIIGTETSINQESLKQEILFGLIFGFLIMAMINSLVLLITLKDIAYLYYFLYITFISILMTTFSGHYSQYIVRYFPWNEYHNKIGILSIVLSTYFNIVFENHLLDLKKHSNFLYKTYYVLQYFAWISIFCFFFLDFFSLLMLYNLYALLSIFFSFGSGLYLAIKGNRIAKYYVWSYFIFVIGIVYDTLSMFQVIDRFFQENIFLYFGFSFEIFIFSIALADKQKMAEEETIFAQKEKIQIQKEANENLEKKVIERTIQLQNINSELIIEKDKSEKLLLNVLPIETSYELKEYGHVKPRSYDLVTILFTDFKGFTKIAEKLSPEELVHELDICFTKFDEIIEKYNLEKLKTIGDSYMCAGGIPKPNDSHAKDCLLAAIEIQEYMKKLKQDKISKGLDYWELRLGIHTGPLVAGVIGQKKFAYDVWGDTVNLASRMESSGDAGKINLSASTYQLTIDDFIFEYRGKISAKNKGEIDMYFLIDKKMKS